MPGARVETLRGLVRPHTSTGFEVQKPPSYTKTQINQMTRERHEELADGESIKTPVGTWTRMNALDGKSPNLIIVDLKPSAELERMTRLTRRERLQRFIKKVSMMD